MAWSTNLPVPNVLVFIGFLSFDCKSAKPEQTAISIIAVLLEASHSYLPVKGLNKGSKDFKKISEASLKAKCYGGGIRTLSQAKTIIEVGYERVSIRKLYFYDINAFLTWKIRR